jgi:hypothetical protein
MRPKFDTGAAENLWRAALRPPLHYSMKFLLIPIHKNRTLKYIVLAILNVQKTIKMIANKRQLQ